MTIESPLDFKEAMVALNMSERTLRSRVAKGEIDYIRDGGKLKFRPSAIEAYLAKRETRAGSKLTVLRSVESAPGQLDDEYYDQLVAKLGLSR